MATAATMGFLKIASHFENGRFDVIIDDVKTEAERYAVRMNIAVSRAFGALRVVVPRGELEKDAILMRIIALTGAS
jgi:hypothetical protein